MASTLAEAHHLLDIARGADRVVAVGYIETYNPAFMAVREIATDPSFGAITSVNIRRVGGLPRSADNVIMDLMTHDMGLLMDLFGKSPDTIHVHKRGEPEHGIVNSAQALLSFGEASATCEANWVSPIKIRQMVVTGTGGFCEADLITQTVNMYSGGENPKIWTKLCFSKEPLRAELQAFLANCESPGSVPMVDAARGLAILDATLKAVASGAQS
jgi:predicted dehydrogenase